MHVTDSYVFRILFAHCKISPQLKFHIEFQNHSMDIAFTSRSAHSGVNVDMISSSSSSKCRGNSPCHECLLCFETVSAHFAESRNTLRLVHCSMFLLLILEVCSPTASMKSMMVGSIDDDVILVVFDGGGGVYYVLNIMGCLCCFERLYVLLVY